MFKTGWLAEQKLWF